MKDLDMMGQPCPIPVIQARKALLAGEEMVTVTVDNQVAVQNLEKMAQAEGYSFAWKQEEKGRFAVTLQGGGERREPGAAPKDDSVYCEPLEDNTAPLTLMITRERLGDGAEELGTMLMKGFVFSLTELERPPKAVIFLNGGARLTTEGAATVPDLRTLEEKGTRVCTCGTCANFFGIKEKLAVGEIVNMMQIVQMMAAPGRNLTL